MNQPITVERRERLKALRQYLNAHIRGQDDALDLITAALIRSELGLVKRFARFLSLGPTGVGKTETALLFTEYLVGTAKLYRVDMSEYQTPETLPHLIGDRRGDRGRLGDIYDQTKTGTLLLDEIEKAHPKILDLLLQILEPGHITLACGETIDLSRFYVVCTSNIASAEILDLHHSSFTTIQRHVLRRAEQKLRPEILNRFDEKVVFRPLDYEVQVDIARLKLDEYLAFLRSQGHDATADDRVLAFLVRHGFDRRLGARPLQRAIHKYVGDAVAEHALVCGEGSGILTVDSSGTRLMAEAAGQASETLAPCSCRG